MRPALLRSAPALLGLTLLGCAATATPTEVAIGVGALPDRPGYAQVVRGVTLAVEALNATAGDGPRFRVVLPDDSATSPVAVAAALRADARIVGVVGHPESGATQAAVPVYAALGERGIDPVAVVSPTATSPALSGISPWFFRVAPSDAAGARDVARFAWDSLRVGIAAVVYRNDAYGRDWAGHFTTAWESRGGTVPVALPYLQGRTDWSAFAAYIAREDPDVVLFPGDAADAELLLTALRAAGARALFIGGDGTEALARSTRFTGVMIATVYQPSNSAESERFLAAWAAKGDSLPLDMFGALAYDAALAIGTAWRASPDKSRAGVRRALERLRLEGAGGPIAFDPRSHDVIGRAIGITRVTGPTTQAARTAEAR
jgi:branched-chain amino acid transport system substrate-binding protein